MPKYEARKREDWVPEHEGDEWWAVYQGVIPRFGRRMTAGEANIIAWALNAVAEGQHLFSSDFIDLGWAGDRYDGPTDGVAPAKVDWNGPVILGGPTDGVAP
jgi:hypothetical protein